MPIGAGQANTEVEVKVFNGINVVSISVPDLDEARRFYRDALGLEEPIYDPFGNRLQMCSPAPDEQGTTQ